MSAQSGKAPEKRVEKLQLMVADSEIEMIDDWRFANRAASRSAAIRALIYLGLQFAERRPDEAKESLDALDRV